MSSRIRTRRRVVVTTSAVMVVLLTALAMTLPVPYVIVSPGPVVNTLGELDGVPVVEISGTPTFPTAGELDLTTVRERGEPYGPLTSVEAIAAYFSDSSVVLPTELLFPPDQSAEESRQISADDFTVAQTNATAAALSYLNIPFTATTVVSSVREDGPSFEILQTGDVITSVNGQPVGSVSDTVAAIQAIPPGQTAALGIERADQPQTVEVTVGANPEDPSKGFIGTTLRTNPDPGFEVDFAVDGIGGPSAGLIFSLAIIDKLTPNSLIGDQTIAGTGTITPDGKVGAIGGIRQKMTAARANGASLFLAPQANCDQVVGAEPDGLTVAAVGTVAEAVDAIEVFQRGQTPRSCLDVLSPLTAS